MVVAASSLDGVMLGGYKGWDIILCDDGVAKGDDEREVLRCWG